MTTANFAKPVTSDLRADVLQYIRDMANAQSRMFDGDTLVNLSVGVVRYNQSNNRFEKWNGATWDVLNITGNVTPTPPGGSTGQIQYNAGGGNFGGESELYWDAAANQLQVTGSARVNSAALDYFMADGLGGFAITSKLAIGGWSRGLTVIKNSDGTITAGAGYLGSNEDVPTLFRIGFGNNNFYNAASTEGFGVTSGGNAGLGKVAPSAWSTSFRALEIGSTGNALWGQVGGNNTWITGNLYYNASDNWTYARTGAAWALGVNAGDALSIRRAPSGTAGTTATPVVLFSIDANGMASTNNNTSSTVCMTLTKNGSSAYGKALLVNTAAGTDGPQIWYRRDGVSEWGVGMTPSGNDFGFYYGGNHGSAGTTRMILRSTGNLEITADNPTSYADGQIECISAAGDVSIGLHAAGASAVSITHTRGTADICMRSNPWSGWAEVKLGSIRGYGSIGSYGGVTVYGDKNGWAGIEVRNSAGTYCATYMAASSYHTGVHIDGVGWRWQCDGSGNFTATGNVTAYSDIRLKKNVTTLEGALDSVRRMRGVLFERIDDGSEGVGVIAQEIEPIAPRVVQPTMDKTLTVAYGNLAAYFIEAIKELANRLEQLEATCAKS